MITISGSAIDIQQKGQQSTNDASFSKGDKNRTGSPSESVKFLMDKGRDPSTLNVGSEHLQVHVPIFAPDPTGPIIPSLVTGFRADVAMVPYMQVQNIYREPSQDSSKGGDSDSKKESVARGSGFSNQEITFHI